jgi:hypothetical protein
MPLPFEQDDSGWPRFGREQTIPELQRIANEALKDVRLVFSEPKCERTFGDSDHAHMDVTITNGSSYLLREIAIALEATGAAKILTPDKYFYEIPPSGSETWEICILATNQTAHTDPQLLQARFTGRVSAEVIPMAVKHRAGYKTVDVWPE